jgi:hypothetical protein
MNRPNTSNNLEVNSGGKHLIIIILFIVFVTVLKVFNKSNKNKFFELKINNEGSCSGVIPYEDLSDDFKKCIKEIEDNLNR